MRQKVTILPVLMLCLIVTACAVRNNSNLTPSTASDLNLVFQLDQANKDYTTFFTDVGNAFRQKLLSPAKVQILNQTGDVVKTLLENANATFKTYQVTKDQPTKVKVLEYMKQATDKLAELLIQRNALLSNGGVA